MSKSGEGDSRSIGDGGANANAKQLTPQQLRDQRLTRFEGGNSQGPTRNSRLNDTPPSSSTKLLTSNSITTSKIDNGLKPPPTNTTFSNNSSSKSIDNISIKALALTKPQPITLSQGADKSLWVAALAEKEDEELQAALALSMGLDVPSSKFGAVNFDIEPLTASNSITTSPIDNRLKSPPTYTTSPNNSSSKSIDNVSTEALAPTKPEPIPLSQGVDKALRVAILAEKEDEDLQAALALSIGLPIPSSKCGAVNFDIEPLPAFETRRERETTSAISGDMLATAAMVVATAPTLGNTPASTAPSTPMRIEEDDIDVVMENDDRKPAAVGKNATPPSDSPSQILRSNPQHFSGRVRTWYESASPYNMLDFHDCMWDKGVTTEHDQKRWLAQGIQFKDEHDNTKHSSTRTRAGTAMATNIKMDASSLLEAIISGPGVWCLTQQHGGPCGVLASIQAELLGILLFGPRTVHPLSMISVDFPDDLSNEFTNAAPDMSRQKMRQVLALSMGMILARSSLMPAATLQDDITAGSDRDNSDDKDNLVDLLPRPEPTARLILPKNELWDTTTCLEWQHLEPWNCRDGGGGVSKHFLTYTVSLNKHPSSGDGGDYNTVKRQKRGSIGREDLENKVDINCDVDIDYTCKELAHAIAQFLLETNSLNWFQRPGGVLLMVMSIAASRGISKTQGDMDDLTAKLTSNFGHCSQELINLLLIRQAVSNVFDHTLRPSGELVCRGIQSQPAIGYLTQLEAMRYLEVGGFYKSPRFPVWVIGSTSHFSVMFGDASALKESASDALLEKVRRAFKRMEGGAEENGFIQTNQLGDFLKSMDLNSVSDHEAQTLAAFMDRYGAGIILWEDLWKRTSRLLTGASIESILDGTDETNNIAKKNSNTMTSESSNTNNIPLSDEELARKLQAEWNDEIEVLPGPSLVNTFDSGPTGSATSAVGANHSSTPTETFGHTFPLYHYNGLRGGNLKAFRVTRLSADEAIGASISLGVSSQASHSIGGFGGGLDAVLGTKWPSCKVDWLNGLPPSID